MRIAVQLSVCALLAGGCYTPLPSDHPDTTGAGGGSPNAGSQSGTGGTASGRAAGQGSAGTGSMAMGIGGVPNPTSSAGGGGLSGAAGQNVGVGGGGGTGGKGSQVAGGAGGSPGMAGQAARAGTGGTGGKGGQVAGGTGGLRGTGGQAAGAGVGGSSRKGGQASGGSAGSSGPAGHTGGSGGSSGGQGAGGTTASGCGQTQHLCTQTCVENTSVQGCGALCTPCPIPANGAATCDGSRCWAQCNAGFLMCNSTVPTCVDGAWSFEDGTVGGFALLPETSDAANGLSISAVRSVDGTHSLAVSATYDCNHRSIEIFTNPCGQANPIDLRGKTLTFSWYLDGPPLPAGTIEIAASALASGGEMVAVSPSLGHWSSVSVQMMDPSDVSTNGFAFQLYMLPSTCAPWTGTVYFDNFRIK
jgi:hypothetical protein